MKHVFAWRGHGRRFQSKRCISIFQCCVQCWREGRECSRGVACLHEVHRAGQRTREWWGRDNGRNTKRLLGFFSCAFSWVLGVGGWEEKGGKTRLNSVVPSGRAFQFGAVNGGGGMGREASWDWWLLSLEASSPSPQCHTHSFMCYDMVKWGSVQGPFQFSSTVIVELFPKVSEAIPLSAGNQYSTLM